MSVSYVAHTAVHTHLTPTVSAPTPPWFPQSAECARPPSSHTASARRPGHSAARTVAAYSAVNVSVAKRLFSAGCGVGCSNLQPQAAPKLRGGADVQVVSHPPYSTGCATRCRPVQRGVSAGQARVGMREGGTVSWVMGLHADANARRQDVLRSCGLPALSTH